MEIRERIWDPLSGRFLPRKATRLADADILHQERSAKVKLQKLGVLISDRWGNDVPARALRGTVTYRAAADLKKSERNFARAVMDDFVNPNLGHQHTPTLTTTNQNNVPFRGPGQFAGGALEAEDQYTRDGINEAGRDDNNVLFTSDISNPHDPINDPIIRALRMSSGSCSMQGGRFFCPLFLVETDVFFRTRQTINQASGPITLQGFFEDLSLFNRRLLLTAVLKFNQGHNSDAWQQSVQSDGKREVSSGAFGNFNSGTWKAIRNGDDILYDNPDPEERPAARSARAAPALRPTRDSAISVNELEPPAVNQNLTEAQNVFRLNQFAETHRRGYTKKSKLVVDFFEGDSQNKKDRIVRLKGFAANRATVLSNGAPGDLAYRVSHLYIGREKDWRKIRDRVRNKGAVDAVIRGVTWDRGLKVTVCVTGRETEGGGKSKVCQLYYYVFQLPT